MLERKLIFFLLKSYKNSFMFLYIITQAFYSSFLSFDDAAFISFLISSDVNLYTFGQK